MQTRCTSAPVSARMSCISGVPGYSPSRTFGFGLTMATCCTLRACPHRATACHIACAHPYACMLAPDPTRRQLRCRAAWNMCLRRASCACACLMLCTCVCIRPPGSVHEFSVDIQALRCAVVSCERDRHDTVPTRTRRPHVLRDGLTVRIHFLAFLLIPLRKAQRNSSGSEDKSLGVPDSRTIGHRLQICNPNLR